MKIHKGGIFDAISAVASYWGPKDKLLPARPATRRAGFRWLGPFNRETNMPLIGFGNDGRQIQPRPLTPSDPTLKQVPIANTAMVPSDAPPYYYPPPAYAVPGQEGAMYVPGAISYGREGGAFLTPVRRCPVDFSPQAMQAMAAKGTTPRGGIFDGESVGGPICTFGQPMAQPVPWQRDNPLYPVPENRPVMQNVGFAPKRPLTPFEGYGAGPDGIF